MKLLLISSLPFALLLSSCGDKDAAKTADTEQANQKHPIEGKWKAVGGCAQDFHSCEFKNGKLKLVFQSDQMDLGTYILFEKDEKNMIRVIEDGEGKKPVVMSYTVEGDKLTLIRPDAKLEWERM